MFIDSSGSWHFWPTSRTNRSIAAAIERFDVGRTSALVRVEAAMVLSTLLNVEPETVDTSISTIFTEAGIEVIASTNAVARPAVTTFACYGKGRGHPAWRNLPDCLVCGAAKAADAPLFFLGDDFSRTDIISVLDDPRLTGS